MVRAFTVPEFSQVTATLSPSFKINRDRSKPRESSGFGRESGTFFFGFRDELIVRTNPERLVKGVWCFFISFEFVEYLS